MNMGKDIFLSRKYKDFTLIRVINMEVRELVYEKCREINKGHIGGLQAEFKLILGLQLGLQLGLRFDLWVISYHFFIRLTKHCPIRVYMEGIDLGE